jgi:hypothetical protein
MRHRRLPVLVVALVLIGAAAASADTVRITVDRALIWNRPSGVSVVVTQLPRGTVLEVVRRIGDWYEIVLPGRPGPDDRPAYIRANQVTIETEGPPSPRVTRLQTPAARRPSTRHPIFILVDAGGRIGTEALTRTTPAFEADYAEAGSIAADYGKNSGWQFGAMGGQFLWGSLGIGLGVEYSSRKHRAGVDALVPNPLYFDADRSAKFTTPTLAGHEVALHIPVMWTPPAYGQLKLIVFGGPTFFWLTKDVVESVDLDDVYPFDTVTVTGAATDTRTGSAFGFHAGADVGYYFTHMIGVGGGARYSRGAIDFAKDAGATTKGAAGGLQIVGGLRLRF